MNAEIAIDHIKMNWTPVAWNPKREPIAWSSSGTTFHLEELEEMTTEELAEIIETY